MFLGAEFIALALLIVYIGAVAVFFLFVVMMLGREKKASGKMKHYPILAAIVGMIILAESIFAVYHRGDAPLLQQQKFNIDADNAAELGRILDSDYGFLMQPAAQIMLVAMIGAVALTLRVRKNIRRQNISEQLSRTARNSITMEKPKFRAGVKYGSN